MPLLCAFTKSQTGAAQRDMDTKLKEKLSYVKRGRSKHERVLSPSPAMMTKKRGHAQNAMMIETTQNLNNLISLVRGRPSLAIFAFCFFSFAFVLLERIL